MVLLNASSMVERPSRTIATCASAGTCFKDIKSTNKTYSLPRQQNSFLSYEASKSVQTSSLFIRNTSRRSRMKSVPQASITIKEPSTGIEFPLVQKFWLGDECRAMGAALRAKKVAFVAVKVYAVALYVEADLAARELGVRDRGGFFENDDDYCSALVDGGFNKVLQMELARDIEGSQFVEALEEALRPRLSLSGETSTLDEFSNFFQSRKLAKGTNIWLMYRTDATLDVVVRPNRNENISEVVSDLSLSSASLCRALFETYLGSNSVVPNARKEWANGARSLLESDNIRRQTRKGGSG